MKPRKNQHFHKLLAATLAVSSSLGMITHVLAQVASGTDIKNTATATFTDGTTTYSATSNEVVIKVAEVAGVTVTAQTPSATTPNSSDTLFVDFVITNTGNDPTQFFIPGVATLSNTTKFSQNGEIEIFAVNGNKLETLVKVPNTGGNTGALLGAVQGSIAPNPGTGTTGTVTIRVPIKVLTNAIAGDTLTVSLGNTSTANAQNQDRTGNENNTLDLYTVDNADGVGGETNATAPINGVREAMATSSSITVNARQQAFAAILKAVSSYSNNSTPNVLTDDVLTYALALKVENPTPPAGLVTSDLHGTEITVNDTVIQNRVLVSDVIPTGMQLSNITNPAGPTGWTPVYTTDDPQAKEAHKAKWYTAKPTVGTITRVGFIYDASTTAIPKGTTVPGFTITLNPQSGFAGGQIANIAQVFGQSQPGAVVPGTATQLVYDESGDQTSNNNLNGTNPDPNTAGGATTQNGGISDGVPNPSADGTDPGKGNDPTANNTNQGQDTGANVGTKPGGGEVTVFTIAATPLNGPNGQPGATGPTGNNDDFTNKSIVVLAGTSPSVSIDPDAITFDNTVQNTSGSQQVISLLPTTPDTATDLIDNVKVTITAGGQTAVYTYTSAGGFVFVPAGSTGTTATSPVKVTVTASGTANYSVTVDLPSSPQLKGYPVPITAFVDTANDGSPTGDPSNITIDRLYTNYLSLLKEARILEANGTTEVVGFTTQQSALVGIATPGRIIEYRITYRNISTTGGTGSVSLPANNLVITENGTANGNTWFSTTIDSKYPSPAIGSAVGTSITVTTGANGAITDINEYKDTVSTVTPGGTGTFTFQRKIK